MTIYLPAGKWIDIKTGTSYTGPTTLTNFNMPLDHVGDAGFSDPRRSVEQELHRDAGIGIQAAGLGDHAPGDGGGGTAQVIGSGRTPRQGRRWRVR